MAISLSAAHPNICSSFFARQRYNLGVDDLDIVLMCSGYRFKTVPVLLLHVKIVTSFIILSSYRFFVTYLVQACISGNTFGEQGVIQDAEQMIRVASFSSQ